MQILTKISLHVYCTDVARGTGFFTVIFLLLIVLASVQFTSWELGTDIEIIVTDSPGIFCLLRILRLWEWKITDWYSASAWKSAFVYETNSTYRMQIDKEASRLCFVYQVHTNVSFLYPSDIQCKIWSKGVSVSVSCIDIIYQYATCIGIVRICIGWNFQTCMGMGIGINIEMCIGIG